MKLLKIFLCFTFMFGYAFGVGSKTSSIHLPDSYFLDVFDGECNSACLDNLLREKKIFSFLSKYKDDAGTKYTQENYYAYAQMFNVYTGFSETDASGIKIAVLVPQKVIKNYALSSANAAIAYLLRQSNDFEIAVFNSGGESEAELTKAIGDIKRNGFRYVIAAITQDGIETLFRNSGGLQVFIPTLHKSFFQNAPQNIVFGGIDYNEQIKALSGFSNGRAVVFSDESKLGLTLNNITQNQDESIIQQIVLESTKDDLKRYFQGNKNINKSSVYLHTPLIMTSLLASQIRVYKHKPFAILSTQINYQPSLLAFTQYEDRENFYIANSIGKIDAELYGINSFLGNDLEYEYVNYAASIGVEFFYKRFFDPKIDPLFEESINADAQVEYNTKIYKTGRYGFLSQIANQFEREADLNTDTSVILGF